MSAIDISYWQHSPDFAAVKASGVERVIMKCGSGEGGQFSQDSAYVSNRAAARAQGLAVGSYFFNGPVDPTAAADYQFSIIDWRPGDIVAIDVENNGNQQHWNPGQVLAWCQRILAHGVPADRIFVYMSASLLGAGWDAVAGLGTHLWVAQYGPNPGSGPWPAWSMWQHTSSATCPGIVGRVDMNQIAPTWTALTTASSSATPITPLEEDDVKLRFITADSTTPWFVTNGLTKRVLAPGEDQTLVDLGLAVHEVDGGGVKQIGQAAVDRIPNA